jgi:hypothetical protein
MQRVAAALMAAAALHVVLHRPLGKALLPSASGTASHPPTTRHDAALLHTGPHTPVQRLRQCILAIHGCYCHLSYCHISE